MPNFDLSPDGKRVVAFPPAPASEDVKRSVHVAFLLHYFDERRRRMPAGGK